MEVNDRKSYSEMILLPTFEERFDYLMTKGSVGEDTFGSARYLNQKFYRSPEWRDLRNLIIARDDGMDLGVEDRPIFGKILVHHINPLTIEEVESGGVGLLDPNNLICVSHITHNALHYGDKSLLPRKYEPRRPGDTKLW